nr:GrpB family protein [Rhodothermaceae bacterium]
EKAVGSIIERVQHVGSTAIDTEEMVARCKVQGARCKVQGARCKVQGAMEFSLPPYLTQANYLALCTLHLAL